MRSTGSPMLFAPPRPPVWIPRARGLVVGRDPDCGLVVPSRKASRHHAEFRCEGNVVVVQDLGSTNGTWVNRQRITDVRALRPGDRIRIGDQMLTYCQVEETVRMASDESDQTAVFNVENVREMVQEAFRGDLAQIQIWSVIQMLAEGEQSGVLAILAPEGKARLWVDSGRPIHAEVGDVVGLDAGIWICGLREGRFIFDIGQPPPMVSLDVSATELLLESSRRVDEVSTLEGVERAAGSVLDAMFADDGPEPEPIDEPDEESATVEIR